MEPVQGGSSVGGRGGENAGSVAVNELFRDEKSGLVNGYCHIQSIALGRIS